MILVSFLQLLADPVDDLYLSFDALLFIFRILFFHHYLRKLMSIASLLKSMMSAKQRLW